MEDKLKGFHVRKRGDYYSAYKMLDGKQHEVYIGKNLKNAEAKINNYLQKLLWTSEETKDIAADFEERLSKLERKVNKL